MKSEAETQIPCGGNPADRSMPVGNPQEEENMHGKRRKALVQGVMRKGTGNAGDGGRDGDDKQDMSLPWGKTGEGKEEA